MSSRHEKAASAFEAIAVLLAATSSIEPEVRADEARSWLAMLARDVIDLAQGDRRITTGPDHAEVLRETKAEFLAAFEALEQSDGEFADSN